MIFEEVDDSTCMHAVSLGVAESLREHVREMYRSMFERNTELQGSLPNAVLAGLTLLWLESVHNVLGSMDYESAIRLVTDCRPNDKQVEKEMKQAARDFLRRSRWLPKVRRKQ
jgi:hypothetical protein